jgi:uncharacterized protein YqgV (UPF0045/DUF77 family)
LVPQHQEVIVTAELSYYPLNDDYVKHVLAFLERLRRHTGITVQTNAMSSHITGSYERVMEVLSEEMEEALSDADCVFTMKIVRAERS